MPLKVYDCPECGAHACKEVELNTFYCPYCGGEFDIEEMGFYDEQQEPSDPA